MTAALRDDGGSREKSFSGATVINVPRILVDGEILKIEGEKEMCDFKKTRLEQWAKQNWDKFYRRNQDKFYRDREWIKLDLLQYIPSHIDPEARLRFLEAGCGVGNMLFPAMKHFNQWIFYAFDFSDNAIHLLNERLGTDSNISPVTYVADLTDSCFKWCHAHVDLITLIFTLSSIHPSKQIQAVKNLKKCIRRGGAAIVRDYGAYDHAMLRFGRDCKIQERFYARRDGTRTFYFLLEELNHLFTSQGFRLEKSEYLKPIKLVNNKQVAMERVFVQATYVHEE